MSGSGGLVWASPGGVTEVAAEGREGPLEGVEVEGAADSVEDDRLPELLPAPATEGLVEVVEPGVDGGRGGGADVTGQEGGEEDGEDVGLSGLGVTGAEIVEVPAALEALEEQFDLPAAEIGRASCRERV